MDLLPGRNARIVVSIMVLRMIFFCLFEWLYFFVLLSLKLNMVACKIGHVCQRFGPPHHALASRVIIVLLYCVDGYGH